MELRHLRQLIALSETLNFHKAAERLHMAQPPLSISIKKLEKELGGLLFVRNRSGVSMTAAGRAAVAHARAALFAAEQLRTGMREAVLGIRGTLRIGFVGSATFTLLPKILPPFRKLYPHVEVVLAETTTIDLVRDLEIRSMDVGLVRLPLLEAADVELHVVEEDHLVVALRADDPLARRRRVHLNMLAERPFILYSRSSVLHRTIITACQDAGFLPKVAQNATQVQTILCLVESGLGVALVPAVAALRGPPGVTFVKLVDPPAIALGIAINRDSTNASALNFVANTLGIS